MSRKGPNTPGSKSVSRAALNAEGFDSLSVPTFRGSTITYPDYSSFAARGERHRSSYNYGLAGTPTTRVLQDRMTELEGAHDTFLVPSGLMAITVSIMAVCEAGDSVLLPDCVYAPVRRFASQTLAKFGVSVTYYDPTDPAAALAAPIDRLKLIWVEAPGSVTMEVADFAAIRALADQYGALLGCDNSWASPILCTPIALGADIVVEALTKYLSGHSDVLMGSISVANEDLANKIHKCMRSLGVGVSPDDCFLVLRGIESAPVRLKHIGVVALSLAEQLENFSHITHVLHPGLESSPFHHLWTKQFRGSSGVFSVVLAGEDEKRFAKRFGNLHTFRLGASWGGAHSIMAPVVLDAERTINRSFANMRIVRLSVGLEVEADLRADIERCLGET